RDSGTDPFDRVDRRLLHPLQELLGVRGERLHVPALTLGVDRVEGERRLPRAARSREDDERSTGELEIDPLQVVLPRVADDDAVFHYFTGCGWNDLSGTPTGRK